MAEFPGLYCNSWAEARRRGELDMWQKSHLANIDCCKAIEAAVSTGFSGEYMDENCVQGVIDQYGFKRVNYVLANTLQRLRRNEQISDLIMQWGNRIFIPPDAVYTREFAVQCHPYAFWNKKAGGLIINKVDAVTGEPLVGVKFKVTYADGSNVDLEGGKISSNGYYTTNTEGQIKILGIVGTEPFPQKRTLKAKKKWRDMRRG